MANVFFKRKISKMGDKLVITVPVDEMKNFKQGDVVVVTKGQKQ